MDENTQITKFLDTLKLAKRQQEVLKEQQKDLYVLEKCNQLYKMQVPKMQSELAELKALLEQTEQAATDERTNLQNEADRLRDEAADATTQLQDAMEAKTDAEQAAGDASAGQQSAEEAPGWEVLVLIMHIELLLPRVGHCRLKPRCARCFHGLGDFSPRLFYSVLSCVSPWLYNC